MPSFFLIICLPFLTFGYIVVRRGKEKEYEEIVFISDRSDKLLLLIYMSQRRCKTS